MGIQNWSEDVVLVDLPEEPQMAEELKAVTEIFRDRGNCDVVMDFSDVDIVTSSSLSKLLKLRKLAADIRDVTKRIMANLAGEMLNQMAQITDPCIVVAHDLSPSDTASIDKKLVHGFVTDLGSATSHTSIMAKALEVPAVVGLHNITAVVSEK